MAPAARPALEQRQQDRHAVRIPGILRLPEIRGGMYLVTVFDVSRGGLRVSCPRALPSGTRAEIVFNGATVAGTTRYAREVRNEWHLGIEADGLEIRGSRVENSELDLTVLMNDGRVAASR